MSLKLYGYWRSSASWRMRWALALKKVDYTYVPVNILKDEHKSPEHFKRSALGALPVMEVSPGLFLSESLAMMEWLEETYPSQGSKLYPGTALDRAQIRELCEIINSETGPLQTPRAQKRHSSDTEERNAWARDFIREGLKVFAATSSHVKGNFSHGDVVTAADICLVPQIYNALRYKIEVSREFPSLWEIYERCLATVECNKASPEKQIDAVL